MLHRERMLQLIGGSPTHDSVCSAACYAGSLPASLVWTCVAVQRHPIYNFLFEYYRASGMRQKTLLGWSPGFGVHLEGAQPLAHNFWLEIS